MSGTSDDWMDTAGPPRDRVRRFLIDHGVAPETIDEAIAEDRLDLLVIDVLLMPASGRYRIEEVADLCGMPVEQVERFWRALGFPDAPEGEAAFGDADVMALTTMQGLLAFRMADLEASIQMARVIGSSMARIAEAEISVSPVLRGAVESEDMAELFALTAEATLPSVALLLEYAWRRHMQAAARRAALTTRAVAGGRVTEAAVGFADLVGFTVLSQQLSESDLAHMVARFEALAHDVVVGHGGRVVKMIGDEVMYVAQDVAVATDIGLRLAEAYADDEILSDVRVGVACGGVIARDGDCYGAVVNLASRIVNIAAPGSVLVADEVHAALADHEGFSWSPLRPRILKDLGRVQLWRVYRPGHERDGDRPGPFGVRLRPGMRLGPERLLERVERFIPPVLDPRSP